MVEKQKMESERLFEESQQAARLKSEFLANMSHEVRTPLNGIIGMTDLVLNSPLAEEQAESLRLVKVSAGSLLAVVNNVLDFSKIEAGKLDLESLEYDFRGRVGDTAELLEGSPRLKGDQLR